MGSTSFNTALRAISSDGKFQSFYINGGAVSSAAAAAVGTGGNPITIGTNGAGNNFPVNAEIFDILVWNAPLTPAQYMQAQMWACDKYAKPYPWAGLTSFNTFFGDSITQGVAGAGTVNINQQAPFVAAQTLGLSFGQWHNVAIGGVTTAHMDTLAATWIDPIPALIGKKHNVTGFEWHNENLANPTLPQPYNHAVTYLANRKLIANQRTVWGTSTSEGADPIANRAAYNASFDAAHPANLIDSYIPIHTDAHIGVDGSYATYTPGGDGVHLSATTYAYLAALFVAGINALP